MNYSLALLRAGQFAEGGAELEEVRQQESDIPHTWFVLGLQYKRAGDYEKAIGQFERMIRLVPADALSHVGRREPLTFLQSYRITQTKALIEDPEQPFKPIANVVGFSNFYHLTGVSGVSSQRRRNTGT